MENTKLGRRNDVEAKLASLGARREIRPKMAFFCFVPKERLWHAGDVYLEVPPYFKGFADAPDA